MSKSLNTFQTRSGFVALIGRPNVGKSSLINKLLGQKIAIVSPKVQTTRTKILGVYNYPDSKGQLVFIDLPGIHKPVDKLGETCLKISQDGAKEADLIIFISEANHSPGAGDEWISSWIKENCPEKNLIILLNKLDLAKDPRRLIKDTERYLNLFGNLPQIIMLSAHTGEGIDQMLEAVFEKLPEGPIYFPEDVPTNRSIRFLCSELVREQALLLTQEEIPHSVAVVIDSFEEKEKITHIRAFILVETESQKGILIGKKGQKIKEIGCRARPQIEELTEQKVFLELKVKVSHKWRQNQKEINKLDLLIDANLK